MTYEIRKINVWSCVKIAFILSGIIGLLLGILYAVMLILLGGFLSQMGGEFQSMGGFFPGALGVFMILFLCILLPIIDAVMGAAATAILAWIYNLLARGLGGIKFNLAEEKLKGEASPQKSDSESEGMLGKYKYE
jgi:hypothetical protein